MCCENTLEPQKIFEELEKLKPEMVRTLLDLISVPAVGPENNGEGEHQKAQVLMQVLQEAGFDKIECFDAMDSRVCCGKRPNIVAYMKGETDLPRLWIVTHLDVVPAGEDSLWTETKAFKPLLKEGRVFGRGSEDNGQSLVASIFAIKALKNLGLKPKRTVALGFVSDEEQGSTFGIQHLIAKGLFRKDDLVIAPDSGNPQGDFIEVAEKSILWLKIMATGKQTHASLPAKGLNAHRAGIKAAIALDDFLHSKYNLKNEFFSEPLSTFEMTRKDKNVDAINIIPGEDVVYFDCRVLPNYDLEEVLGDFRRILSDLESSTGAKFYMEVLQRQSSPPIKDTHSAVVVMLKNALRFVRGVDAKVGGIGGGTCAAFFRKEGISAVVWSTIDEVAHQPNEYANIHSMVEDAKVFAYLFAI
jgi:succinyl-diaminopimelate desuccinylase